MESNASPMLLLLCLVLGVLFRACDSFSSNEGMICIFYVYHYLLLSGILFLYVALGCRENGNCGKESCTVRICLEVWSRDFCGKIWKKIGCAEVGSPVPTFLVSLNVLDSW